MARNRTTAKQSGDSTSRRTAPKARQGGDRAPDGDRRFTMIREAAYFRALSAGFDGDPEAHWLAAEQEIDALLGRR